jgi:hypothetical protein
MKTFLIRRTLVGCILIVLCGPISAGQRWQNAGMGKIVGVPKELVQQLKRDEDYGAAINIGEDGSAQNLVVGAIDLNGDVVPELIVSGINDICAPVGNCIHWVFEKSLNDGYRLLLREDGVQTAQPQNTYTNSYRDILMTSHSSAFEQYLSLFKYDGTRYKVDSCSLQKYDVHVDKHGEARVSRVPKVTRVKCRE